MMFVWSSLLLPLHGAAEVFTFLAWIFLLIFSSAVSVFIHFVGDDDCHFHCVLACATLVRFVLALCAICMDRS